MKNGASVTVLDSNIFIYILDEHPEFYEPARAAFKAAAPGRICVPTLTLTEIQAGTTNNEFLRFFEDSVIELHDLTSEIAVLAGELRYKLKKLKTADAIHLATALVSGSNRFITNDATLFKLDIGLKILPLSSFAA